MRSGRWLLPVMIALAVGITTPPEASAAVSLAPTDTLPAPGDSLPADPAIIQLQFGRLLGAIVQAHRIDDMALLPASVFFTMAEIHYRLTPDGILTFTVQPGNTEGRYSLSDSVLTLGRTRIPVTPRQSGWQAGELFLDAAVLARALGITMNIDWAGLQVTVLDPDLLPVGRRMRREQLRRSFSNGQDGVAPDLALDVDRSGVGGVVVDYSVLTPSEDLFQKGAWSAGLGVGVLGGSFRVSMANQQSRGTRTEANWSGVWRTSRYLTQLKVGDAFATGPRPRSSRGIALTNAPYLRAPGIGSIPFAGVLGPGWQVEAYRGGRLVSYDSVNALGQFSVDVPIQYGENPVDFVAYGPFGEIREFNQTYRVLHDQLPSRRFEYGASLGACRTDRCDVTGNVDVRYGLSPRWSIQAGLDQFWRDTLPDLVHPYAAVTGSFGALGIRGEVVRDAFTRGQISYEPSTELRLSVEAATFDDEVADPLLTPEGRQSQWTAQAFFRPVAAWEAVFLEGSYDRTTEINGRADGLRLGFSAQSGGTRFLPAVRLERSALGGAPSTTRTLLSLNTISLGFPALGPILGSLTSRTTVETDGTNRIRTLAGFVSRSFARWRVETGISWRRETGTALALTLTTELPGLRSTNTVTSSDAGTVGSHFIQGSLQARSTHAVSFATNPSVERAGVAGRVFLDLNGNGAFDPGEDGLPGIRVRVGFRSVTTDAKGQYRAWDLTPWEPTLLVVDSLSLPSPLWTPAFSSASVEAAPNGYRAVDIPVLPGGVVEGRVIRNTPTGPGGVGGVRVLLRNRDTGGIYSLLTFTDGSFYAMGIRPGSYDALADAESLAALGATASQPTFVLRPDRDGDTVSDLTIVLTPF